MVYIQKRAHFILMEENCVPLMIVPQSESTVVFQAAIIQKQLDTMVMDYLFSRKKELLIIGLFVLGAISTLALIYNAIEINGLKTMISQIPQIIKVSPP